MDLDIQICKGLARFTVLGAIDSAGGNELTAKFKEIALDDSVRSAMFDLTETPSITSAGIGKLLTFAKHFDAMGGSLRITGISASLRKQFIEIHMDKIIPIE